MKKIVLLTVLVFSSFIYGQEQKAASPFDRGVQVPYVVYIPQTTTEINALVYGVNDRVIINNKTLDKWVQWDGDSWEDFGSGGTTDHTLLTNIGINNHDAIDTHIADSATHYTKNDIDLWQLGDVVTNSVTANEILTWTGINWENKTAAELGLVTQSEVDGLVTKANDVDAYYETGTGATSYSQLGLNPYARFSLDAATKTATIQASQFWLGNQEVSSGLGYFDLTTLVNGTHWVWEMPSEHGKVLLDAPSDGTDYVRNNAAWVASPVGGNTDLSLDVFPSAITINSSTGVDVSLQSANAISSGLLTSSDYNLLHSLSAGTVTETGAQTLTNKTIAFGSNTLSDVMSLNTAQTITADKNFDRYLQMNSNWGLRFGNTGTGPSSATSVLWGDATGTFLRMYDGDLKISDNVSGDRFTFFRTTGAFTAIGDITADKIIADGSGLTNVFTIDVNSPVKPIVWMGTEAAFNIQFPSGAPTNYFSVKTDATPIPVTVDVVSNVAASTILGRITAGSADSEELTAPQVRTLINVEDGSEVNDTGAEIVSKIDTELGSTDWQTGGSGGSPTVITTITQYTTVASLPAVTGSETDTYVYITNDTTKDLNGLYAIVGGAWKLLYAWDDVNMPATRSVNLLNEDYVFSGTPSDGTEEGIIENYRLNLSSDGITSATGSFISDFIPVRYGDRLRKANNGQFWFYRKDKSPFLWSEGVIPYNLRDYCVVDNREIAYIRWTGTLANLGVSDMIVRQYDTVANADPTGWVDYNATYDRNNTKYVYEDEAVIYEKPTNNLYNYGKGIYSHGYGTTGVESQSWTSSGFIPCKGGTPYALSTGANAPVSFWDAEKTFISGVSDYDGFVTPATARFFTVDFSRTTTDYETVEIYQGIRDRDIYYNAVSTTSLTATTDNPISICLIGDSIGTEDSTFATESAFATYLRETLKIETFHNLSVSGIAYDDYQTSIDGGRYNTPVADVYIIQIGTNDFGFNRALGSFGDTAATNTFYGSIQDLIEGLTALNANAKIVFTTPIPRATAWDENAASLLLQDYSDAIIAYASSNNYPYLDLWDCGINPYNSQTNTNWFISSDGIHPNNEAHKTFIYPKVVQFIKQELRR